jgi:hypothetical protein
MSAFEYTPDKAQRIHAPGAIALICSPFQSHENGLPEWVKNAADAYTRAEAKPVDRVIVILTCDLLKHGPPSIACLDFVGTTSEHIERYFRHWADPEAAAQGTGSKVQGGHGNGGKCYMTQMFQEFSLLHTVREGRGCRYGTKGGTTTFGYVPGPQRGRDYVVEDLNAELSEALKSLNCPLSKLPQTARDALERAEGFTLVRGVRPKHFDKKIRITDLLGQLRDHPQMLTSLEYASVYVVHNGRTVRDASPLSPTEIVPIPGSGERRIDIPEYVADPVGGAPMSTTADGTLPPGELVLLTSKTSMRWKKKARHTINYRTPRSGFIGYRSMLEFPVTSGYRDKIYGECHLDALLAFKQNDRANLAESPLTRAVDHFIAEQVQLFAEEFEKQDRTAYSKKERNELSRMNEALDRWKNRFIRELMLGQFGTGGGPTGKERLPAGKPSRIEVTVTHPRLGIGVAIRPHIRFFDGASRQVRPTPYRWVSEDTNVALVDDDLMLINSFSAGETVIYAELMDGGLQSNRVPIQVIRIRSIDIEPKDVTVAAGSRTQLRAKCWLSNGEMYDNVALIWTEQNASVARVGSSGLVFGINPGTTDVVAGDDRVVCDEPTVIQVSESSDDDGSGGSGKGGSGSGRGKGRGYPLILVSGEVDEDPQTRDYVHFSSDDPPIMQRPQDSDRNIWWINSSAPLAKLFLSKDSGFGYESREWRMYHVERYMDVMTQILIMYDSQIEGALTKQEFFLMMADKLPELQSAIAEELAGFITDGAVPQE